MAKRGKKRPGILESRKYLDPDGFPVTVMHRRVTLPVDLHAHQFVELVVVTAGAGRHFLEDESWPIGAGDVFVLSGSRTHGYRELEDLEVINILYDPGRLDIPDHDLRALPGYHALFTLEPMYRKRHRFRSRLHLTTEQLATAAGMILALETELDRRPDGYRFMAAACFMQLVGYLSRCYQAASAPASEALLRVGAAISHLEHNYARPITLEELARMAHMSKRNFLRVFREGTGHTPIDHLIRLRISRAAALLADPVRSIAEVGRAVGFQDSNYFARRFRGITGMSPREYRRRGRPFTPS